MCDQLQHQVERSFDNGLEKRWVKIAEVMEEAVASGNIRLPFKFMNDTDGRRTLVSEVLCDRNDEFIHGE